MRWYYLSVSLSARRESFFPFQYLYRLPRFLESDPVSVARTIQARVAPHGSPCFMLSVLDNRHFHFKILGTNQKMGRCHLQNNLYLQRVLRSDSFCVFHHKVGKQWIIWLIEKLRRVTGTRPYGLYLLRDCLKQRWCVSWVSVKVSCRPRSLPSLFM